MSLLNNHIAKRRIFERVFRVTPIGACMLLAFVVTAFMHMRAMNAYQPASVVFIGDAYTWTFSTIAFIPVVLVAANIMYVFSIMHLRARAFQAINKASEYKTPARCRVCARFLEQGVDCEHGR